MKDSLVPFEPNSSKQSLHRIYPYEINLFFRLRTGQDLNDIIFEGITKHPLKMKDVEELLPASQRVATTKE